MGQYLYVGIAQSITVKKRGNTKEEIINKYGKNLNVNLYDTYESDNYLNFTLKEEILEKNVLKLLEEIKLKVVKRDEKFYEEALVVLKDKKYKEIYEIAKDNKLYKFQYLEGNSVCNDVSYLFDGDLSAYCDIITIEGCGKVIFECYNDMFYFLRNSVIGSLNNELKDSLVVTIIG